jgi:hypothetical protein
MKTNYKKLTQKYFISICPEMAKIKRKDPTDFEILFNNWKRLKNKGNI